MNYERDIVLDLDFWDCECEGEYIHSRFREFCIRCGCLRRDQPYSRASEVSRFLRTGRLEVNE